MANKEIVEILLKANSSLLIRNKKEETPECYGHPDFLKKLDLQSES